MHATMMTTMNTSMARNLFILGKDHLILLQRIILLIATYDSILHTQDDLDRMKDGVTNKRNPWYPAFLNMSADPLASSSYQMKGPLPYVTRKNTGHSPGKTELSYDSVAAVLNALMLVCRFRSILLAAMLIFV